MVDCIETKESARDYVEGNLVYSEGGLTEDYLRYVVALRLLIFYKMRRRSSLCGKSESE